MSFSRRRSTEPSCWGDGRVPEEDPPPAKASFYWNGSCKVKEGKSGRVKKKEAKNDTQAVKSAQPEASPSASPQRDITLSKKTNKLRQLVATLITIIKK